MITCVEIPKLTLTMEGGTILRWLKQENEPVEKDDILFELETDKAVVEVPSPAQGILKKILLHEGEVPVGKTIAFIGDASDAIPEIAPDTPLAVSPATAVSRVRGEELEPAAVLRTTPAARRRAKELSVDLTRVQGSGPHGRITQDDVELVAKERDTVAPPLGNRIRTTISERMTNAWQTVPHIHIGGQLKGIGLRRTLEKARSCIDAQVSMTDLLLYAVARLLKKFPALNTVWHENRPVAEPQINLAFAVHTEHGVVAPVISAAEGKSLAEISAERRKLVGLARSMKLALADLEGGTFTLTNLGMYTVDFFVPIINYPQSAILATGRLNGEDDAVRGAGSSAPRIWVNLALDHRVADGAYGGMFLKKLEEAFETLDRSVS